MNANAMPKVELHCHLEACFQPQTVKEIGKSLGLDIPADPDRFRREWLITEPVSNLEQALKKFGNVQTLWGSEEAIERLACEACEYGVEQGIRIFELRYSPNFVQGANASLSFEKIHQAILRGINRAERRDIAIGLIGIVQKTLSLKEANYTADFIIENRESFVGIDMADMDIGFEMGRFAPLLARAKKAGLRVTLHAGEEDGPDAPQQTRFAIEVLGAERIGHGIHVIRDPAVMDFIRERAVLLELCPTSNWLTNAVPSIRHHPIRRLMEAGLMVSVNSDDPHLFGIDLCHEYDILRREQGFTAQEFDLLNDYAAALSFLPLAEKQRVWPREIPAAPSEAAF